MKKALGTKFDVQGIPALIFLDAQGEIINESGRQLVYPYEAQGDVELMWSALIVPFAHQVATELSLSFF